MASLVVLACSPLLDDVMAVPHLYYRERLATVFVGFRQQHPSGRSLRYEQPPWTKPILFSAMQPLDEGPARFPKLVVCATANLSGDVPLGRAGTGFTFEKDFAGSPVTGYVSTAYLERLALADNLTMPALMGISGAAVAPSMGKMTRPAGRSQPGA